MFARFNFVTNVNEEWQSKVSITSFFMKKKKKKKLFGFEKKNHTRVFNNQQNWLRTSKIANKFFTAHRVLMFYYNKSHWKKKLILRYLLQWNKIIWCHNSETRVKKKLVNFAGCLKWSVIWKEPLNTKIKTHFNWILLFSIYFRIYKNVLFNSQ